MDKIEKAAIKLVDAVTHKARGQAGGNPDLERSLAALSSYLARGRGQIGLALGGYAYYPNASLTSWTASDGSVIKAPLARFLADYGDEYTMEIVGDANGDFGPGSYGGSLIVGKRVDQQGYEGGALRGDWR